jgi:NAD(P)-dependent dehydrogenase (short-subunit alcohol dehydrogenase family)
MSSQKNTRRPTAFVTGASQGIGVGIAMALARDGYDVAVASRSVDKLPAVIAELKSAGAHAIAVELDLRSQDSMENAMGAVIAGFGELDLLVNNSGVGMRKNVLEISAADWDNIIGVNLSGAFFMSQRMGRHLIKGNRPGCIINIASTHGLVALAKRTAYGVAKAGMIHLTKMLAIEWADAGIRVNAVAPGSVITPARAALPVYPGHAEERLARIPMHRTCTIDEVAGAVSYLASPRAAYITGQTLILDGGLTSQ